MVGGHAGGFKVEDGVGGHGLTLGLGASLRERAATDKHCTGQAGLDDADWNLLAYAEQ